jgi:hypothetical protein
MKKETPVTENPSAVALQAVENAQSAGYSYLEKAILFFDATYPGHFATSDELLDALMDAELPEEVLAACGIIPGWW